MKSPSSYIIPLEVTLNTRDSTAQATLQIPDGGFRILRFFPRGFVSSKLLVPPTIDTASDQFLVSWRCEQDRVGQTDGAVSIWSLGALHESPLWNGIWFAERKKLEFNFRVTSDRTALTLPATIGFDIWGIIGNEIETLDVIRYNSYRSLQGTTLLNKIQS